MDVRMPDGTVVQNVPEGTTQSQLNSRFAKYQASQQPAAQAQPPAQPPDESIGRQVGLAGRAVVNAVAGIPQMAADAGVAAVNLAHNISHGEMPTLADFNPFAKSGGSHQEYELPSQSFNKALTSVGVPEPKSASEKIAGFVEGVLTGSRIPAPQATQQAPANFVKSNPLTAVRDQTLQAAQKEGYVVPPATTNPTILNRAAEGASGKIATAQQAAVRNQAVTNRLAKQALGLSNDAPLTPESLKNLRSTAGAVYDQVASAGKIVADDQYLDDLTKLGRGVDEIAKDFPEANVGARKEVDGLVNSLLRDKFDSSSALKYLRQLRNDAAANLSSAARNPDPSKQALGMAQREAAATLEDLIGRHLAQSGQPELAQSFQQARKLIAVSHTVENALNEATGNISAAKLANQLKGKPYGGELQIAAKFAQAFPKAAKEVNESMPGISPLDYYGSIGAAGLFNSPHLLALPALRMAIREALLSPYGQKAAVASAKAAGEAPKTIGVTASTALAGGTAPRQEQDNRARR
jgi:hypothetical protein